MLSVTCAVRWGIKSCSVLLKHPRLSTKVGPLANVIAEPKPTRSVYALAKASAFMLLYGVTSLLAQDIVAEVYLLIDAGASRHFCYRRGSGGTVCGWA